MEMFKVLFVVILLFAAFGAVKFMNRDRWTTFSVFVVPVSAVYGFVYFLNGWEGVRVFSYVTFGILLYLLFVGFVEYIGSSTPPKNNNNDLLNAYLISNFFRRQ